MQTTETDRRYRIGVLLYRSDRPQALKFHCPFCKSFVAELVNTEVKTLTDLTNADNISQGGTGIRCSGHCFGNGNGRAWFYFLLGEGR